MCCKISLFTCPVCGNSLEINGKSYKCINNHSFDSAKSGYVNLLTSDRMNAKNPGDNKLMVKSRSDFLDKGYYGHLLEKLCESVYEIVSENNVILDAGCGEGYYTSGIYNYLCDRKMAIQSAGIDISKHAVDKAAKRCHDIQYAVGSIFHIPVSDSSCNILLNVFAPFCRDEFFRIINDGGYMVMVIPGRKHLWELKNIVYERPYENNPKPEIIDGFVFLKKYNVQQQIELESNEDILNLFAMTPYFYNTRITDREKLSELNFLKTNTEFEILIYRKGDA